MVRGKLGFPRPLAVETELVDVTFQGLNLSEATLEGANGHIIMGDKKPFFEIFDVIRVGEEFADNNEISTIASLEAESFIDVWDIRLWANNLRNFDVSMISPKNIQIVPNITANRAFGEVPDDPVLILKFTSNRGTHEEFVDATEKAVSKFEGLTLEKDEHTDGEHIYYVSTRRKIQINHAIDIARDILGPRNKRVTDVYATTVGVGLDE